MGQDLFAFDDEEPPAAPSDPQYSWNWWDPWPAALPRRTQLLWQIKRDLRALGEIDSEEEIPFYTGRIRQYREALRKELE